MSAPVLLQTEQLTRAFGSLLAVDRVDRTIRRGELRSIIGPNGAGKTTLFRLISGEIRPTGGSIRFDGREITGLPRHHVARLGIAKSYQITNVFPHLSVLENVRVVVQGPAQSFDFWSRADRLDGARDRAVEILARVPLERKAGLRAPQLSHGDPRQWACAADLPRRDRMTLLALEDVHAFYGEAHILQGISLTVHPGEVVTLIGRNGAGKTTTLRSIMGIAAPKRGRVRFRDEDISRLPTHEIARRGIAYVPEERRVLPNLTVLENLRLGTLGARRHGPVGIDQALDFFPRLRERIAHKGRL